MQVLVVVEASESFAVEPEGCFAAAAAPSGGTVNPVKLVLMKMTLMEAAAEGQEAAPLAASLVVAEWAGLAA